MESLRPSEAELKISIIVSCENSFSRFTRKRKVLELRVVISANINLGVVLIYVEKPLFPLGSQLYTILVKI